MGEYIINTSQIWRGVRNLEGGELRCGAAQMKYHECMRLWGSAAVSRHTFIIHEGCLENPKCTKCNSMQ